MFTSLKKILPRALEKNNLSAPIQQIEKREKAQNTIRELVGDGIEVIRCQRELVLRVRHHALAHEIRMREREVKGRLKEEGIMIEMIKYA